MLKKKASKQGSFSDACFVSFRFVQFIHTTQRQPTPSQNDKSRLDNVIITLHSVLPSCCFWFKQWVGENSSVG
jgi:hypothetical protein